MSELALTKNPTLMWTMGGVGVGLLALLAYSKGNTTQTSEVTATTPAINPGTLASEAIAFNNNAASVENTLIGSEVAYATSRSHDETQTTQAYLNHADNQLAILTGAATTKYVTDSNNMANEYAAMENALSSETIAQTNATAATNIAQIGGTTAVNVAQQNAQADVAKGAEAVQLLQTQNQAAESIAQTQANATVQAAQINADATKSAAASQASGQASAANATGMWGAIGAIGGAVLGLF